MRCEICLHDAEPHSTGPVGPGVGAYCGACPQCEHEIAAWSAFALPVAVETGSAGGLLGRHWHIFKGRSRAQMATP